MKGFIWSQKLSSFQRQKARSCSDSTATLSLSPKWFAGSFQSSSALSRLEIVKFRLCVCCSPNPKRSQTKSCWRLLQSLRGGRRHSAGDWHMLWWLAVSALGSREEMWVQTTAENLEIKIPEIQMAKIATILVLGKKMGKDAAFKFNASEIFTWVQAPLDKMIVFQKRWEYKWSRQKVESDVSLEVKCDADN